MSNQQDYQDFEKKFAEEFKKQSPKFDGYVNIALVGKVSTGKSSLLNAILGCEKNEPLAEVGAMAGVQKKITPHRLDDHVLIIDCPGLDDVRKESSSETKDFLSKIDFGIFVVTGAADLSQKENYDDLKKNAKKTIVVLNKIDEWDDLEESALEEVVKQWKSVLGTQAFFPACAKGYDPKMRKNAPMDLRGIDSIRTEIFKFLQAEGKAILLARHIRNKKIKAHIIIHGYAVVAGATSAAFASIPLIGPITGDSAILIIITAEMGQSLSRDVFNRRTEKGQWKNVAMGLIQFFLGVTIVKTLSSLIPVYGNAVNAATSIVTVESIGWVAYRLLDEGTDLDKLSKEDIGKALDWAKKQGNS